MAQENPTPDASPVVTPEATRESVIPVAVNSAGGSVTINTGSVASPAPTGSSSQQSPADAANPLYIVVVVVLAALLVAAMVFGGYIIKFLATLVPPETAASIYESGMRMGLKLALNEAAKTTNPYDDEFFIELARRRGLEAVKDPVTGAYDVRPQPSTATSGRASTASADPAAFLTSPSRNNS